MVGLGSKHGSLASEYIFLNHHSLVEACQETNEWDGDIKMNEITCEDSSSCQVQSRHKIKSIWIAFYPAVLGF